MAKETQAIDEVYASQRLVYEAFTENASELLKKLIDEAGIDFASIEKRTKSLESLRGKIERGDKVGKYETLQDITDLSGIRIITFLKEDCKKISMLLKDNFLVDNENSADKEDEVDPDRFGYQSIHLILSYKDSRTNLPEFKRFSGLKFEVQVKTILQHTWSAIDWKLRYKRSSEAPKKLRRRLFRISALLDAADDELSYVYEQVSDIKSYYAAAISRGDLSLEMDFDSVDALLTNRAANNGSIHQIINKFSPIPNNQNEKQEIASADKILSTLRTSNITNLIQLDTRLKYIDDIQIKRLQSAVNNWLSEIKTNVWSTNRFDIARMALLMTSSPDIAKAILEVSPFNPVFTIKLKKELEIDDPVS